MAGPVRHVRARFRTQERAARAYADLVMALGERLEPPELDDPDTGHPWVLDIVYDEGEQSLVLGIVARYGGVTYQEAV